MRLARSAAIVLGISATALTVAFLAQRGIERRTPGPQATGKQLLANGWMMTPAGIAVALPGDMPGSIVALDDRHVAVNTCGYHDHSVSVIDLTTQTVVQKIDLWRDWVGMTYDAKSGELLISGGSPSNGYKRPPTPAGEETFPSDLQGAVLRLTYADGKLTPAAPLEVAAAPKNRFVSSLLARADGRVYVVDIQNDTVHFLGADRAPIGTAKVGYRPYGLALSSDGKTLAVSNWGDQSVTLLDAESLEQKALIKVGQHPNALTYGPDGRLFVSNGSSNSVSVIANGAVTETISTALKADETIGASPVAVAIRNGRLYVANADNNSVAVVDIAGSKSKVLGFIPTGRYPATLGFTPDSQTLLVATAKGMRALPNVTPAQLEIKGQGNDDSKVPYTYVANLLAGHVSFVPLPSDAQLKVYSAQVMSNRPATSVAKTMSRSQRQALGALKKIEHVIYVIRENRTYDQVLGDDPRGNGEPRLTMFGEDVTPNSHQLARDFVLLDNLYCDGEVSQVGHQWTDAAYATDYNEKQWILNYSRHGEVDSDAMRLNSSPAGYIWDNAKRNGKSIRVYGEYVKWQEDHGSAEKYVKDHFDELDLSRDWETVFARGGRDTEKIEVFIRDLKLAEKTGKLPNMVVMALPDDHTNGVRPGSHTPEAMVACNDLAVGKLVDAVSHSKFWPTTAIFVIQDDAQAGPDHVDAHRTVGHFISAYTRRGTVDSTHYTTSSMIRSMELALGLPALTQYSAAATPMLNAMATKPDLRPWTAVAPKIDIEAMNPTKGELVERSLKLDLSDIDRADEREFNEILWAWCKPGVPYPDHLIRPRRR